MTVDVCRFTTSPASLAGTLTVFIVGLLAGCTAEAPNTGAGTAERGSPPAQNTNVQSGEDYEETDVTPFHDTSDKAISTFSIDVDNGSYTLMRRDIQAGRLPVATGVRAEEYVNFFDYDYPEPQGEHPVSLTSEVGPSEFGPERGNLLRIGVNAESMANGDLPPLNLVFLVDVSGSMQSDKKLPLVKQSLRRLVRELDEQDTVGIVTYAGSDGVALRPTSGDDKQEIRDAIDDLESGGSTNGEAGIKRAYEMAESERIEGGINRVLLATDGDFNVGKTGDDLEEMIETYREKHISLTNLGYGSGNLNEATLEALARKGNGNYYYIDKEKEAERLFGPDLASTLAVVAADVKIQVEFDSDAVQRYRLVGYDNRALNNEDFEDDDRDAGELGANDTVTAYYEFVPVEEAPGSGELAEVRLRYKDEYGESSDRIDHQVPIDEMSTTLEKTTPDFRFGAAVAEYAEILRGSKHSTGTRFEDVESMARNAAGDSQRRGDFAELVDRAQGIWKENGGPNEQNRR